MLGRAVTSGLNSAVRLKQGQVWKLGDQYFRIIEWARLSIQYKVGPAPMTRGGRTFQVTKKEFCNLIRGATLVVPESLPAATDAVGE